MTALWVPLPPRAQRVAGGGAGGGGLGVGGRKCARLGKRTRRGKFELICIRPSDSALTKDQAAPGIRRKFAARKAGAKPPPLSPRLLPPVSAGNEKLPIGRRVP